MQRAYFEDYLAEHGLADEWWVSVEHDVLDRLMTLDEVADLEYELPGRNIALLHPDVAEDEETRWVHFDFQGIANLKDAPMIGSERASAESTELVARVEQFAKELSEVKQGLHELRVQVDEVGQMLREVLQMNQMKEELDGRRQFIEASEEALLAKTIRYEQQIAELDQQRDDLASEVTRSGQQRSA